MSDNHKNLKDHNNINSDKNKSEVKHSEGRRDALKALATLPVLGVLAYGVYKKKKNETQNQLAGNIFNINEKPAVLEVQPDGKTIRIGIIGFGIRGSQLMQALGFATPEYIENLKEQSKKDPQNTRYKDFLEQDSLNVRITGVCDIFEVYAHDAAIAGANIRKEGTKNAKPNSLPTIYKHYKELLAAKDIDAVIIASPDHWHGTMVIDAVKAGKHVYGEKPMTWTVPETYMVKEAVENSKVVFQLGHQGRQIEINHRAKQIIEKGLIGKVTLMEVSTNRNDPNGAWVYPIHPSATPKNIDWKQFEGNPDRVKEYMEYMTSAGLAKYVGPDARDKFSLERFFRWRCWWDYSTGLSGDLLTHEYDVMNHIMDLGIPGSATSSGGVYYFKDGRTVPDVLQTTFEFPDRDMSLLYTATLASQYNRPRKIMGSDATLELGSSLNVIIDKGSIKYKDKIDQGMIKTGEPFYRYASGKSVDALSSATEKYFAERGLLFSYVEGKRYNTTFLHLREWLECIRQGLKPSCGIKEAFEEAITAHMGTRAYLEGRTMYWDKDKNEITKG
ncbi:MAG: Gfo/Idh/MocA family oxidoreductase [Paludibacter sp.]|nr:Gfo/Idh/MocA family oxidoreductase [Paludibacter sp.]